MQALAIGMHHKTPQLSVVDPRGLSIRSVDYCRNVETEAAQVRINRTSHNAAGHAVKQWDPRLWLLQEQNPSAPANLVTVHSLPGVAVSTLSVDAGSQINLLGLANEVLQGWDSRGTQREVKYDDLLRPVSVFEHLATEPRRCAERMEYGRPGQGSQDNNLFGQLIRRDGPGGTVLFESFGITGQCTRHVQHFAKEAVAPDWPEPIVDRNELLEPGDGAVSTWRFGPKGFVLESVDGRQSCQNFGFTLDGRLRHSALKLAGKLNWQTLVSEIEYSAEGQITREVAGNDVQTTLKYCPEDGRLLERRAHSDSNGLLQHLFYTYDRMGNVLSIEDKALPVRYFNNQRIEPVSRYNYDSLYQLIAAAGWEAGAPNQGPASVGRNDPAAFSNYHQTYSYDESGNLLKLTHVGAQSHGRDLKAAPYSNRCLPWRNDEPPTEEEIAAAFDASGNLLELDPGRLLTWDLRNQLQSVSPVARDSGRNDVESYLYDGGGQRVRKIRALQTNARAVIAEVRYLPGLELRTNSGTGEVLHVITAQAGLNTVRVLHWESDPPSGSNDQYRYNLVDHLGSCTVELSGDALVISREIFYPFGDTACFAGGDAIEVNYKTIRYSGKERDATGLYYYGFRYYVPWLQRWASADPALDIDGLNLYRMVRNNPVGLSDENGLAPDPEGKVGKVSQLRGLFGASGAPPQPVSVRPPIPARPVALQSSVRPPVPTRPSPISANTAAPVSAPPPKRPPPPVALPSANLSAGVLPTYAGGSMTVGSHSLMITQSGSIVAMRGDDRPPDKIHAAGGFYPRDNRGPVIKQEFRQAVLTKGFNTLANEHVRSPVAGYVSTGMDEDSGGYGDSRAYLYRMEIPGMEERSVNEQTLGLGSPFKFNPKGRLDARFLMSSSTLDQADFAAMIPPMTVEMTFITPIPSAYIVAYRERGNNQWKPFH